MYRRFRKLLNPNCTLPASQECTQPDFTVRNHGLQLSLTAPPQAGEYPVRRITFNTMISTISYNDFKELLDSPHREYYLGRWEYYKEVINIIQQTEIEKVLELGPGFLPIVKEADVMLSPEEDHFGRPEHITGKIIVHDATIKPWPIPDKQYDLLIALQVWEHLDNKQTRAFREVQRISKRAILSFPFEWIGGKEKPSHRAHRGIDKELIDDWTLNIPAREVIEVQRTGSGFSKGKRLIYYWEF